MAPDGEFGQPTWRRHCSGCPPQNWRLSRPTVAQELARVYRQARTGEIEGNETRTLIAALRELRACLEASDLEHRIEALEQGIVAPRASAPPPPGLKLISRHE